MDNRLLRRVKKALFVSFILLLLISSAALAEDYTFSDFCARLTLPSGTYNPVVTATNYSTYEDFLIGNGYDYDTITQEFGNNGLKMIAFDQSNGRRLVVTARQDVDAQQYFDLNLQDEDMRKNFRVSHTDGSTYAILGYDYSSAAWKNYGSSAERFLQTRYTLRQNGALICTGAQRRTIRNGYTITLDMQVYGRNCTDADVSALEGIMKTFTFTQVLPMPKLPVKLLFSSEPPRETHDETFVLKGTTAAKAALSVNVIGISSTSGTSYNVNANSSGEFSQKITLPGRGTYAVTVTASREGDLDNIKTYSVAYDPNRIIATMTQTVPDVLTDETVIKGTTEGGVTTQLVVSGAISYTKSVTGRNFSFTLDTRTEGTYYIRVVMSKKGFNERTFEYVGTRTLTDDERRMQLVSGAIKPEYSKLIANSASYNGQIFGYTGYLVDLKEGPGDYLYTVALGKTNNNYKNYIYINSDAPVMFSMGSLVKVYACKTGDIVTINPDGTTTSIPQFDLLFMESGK